MGGPGLAFETWVFQLLPIGERNPGLKSETWATHSTFVRSIFMLTSPCLAGRLLMNLFRNQLVLVRGKVVDVGCNCGAPAHPSRIERAEVVIMEPAITTELRLGCPVERVEAYPQAVGVGPLHERA